MTSQRTICVVTGTRAEYGLLESSMRAIRDRDELQLTLVVTGMHLSPQYGETYRDIESDGFEIDHKVDMLVDGDSGLSMAKSTGLGILGLGEAFRDIDPDIVLVLGDRDEPLATAVAAAHMNIPVAHIHGGDAVSGAVIDDSIRHAVTKFSHLHFPASDRSAERVVSLGEEDWRITTAGAPGLDAIRTDQYVPGEEMRARLDIDSAETLLLCVQHPVTTQPELAGEQMNATLDALESFEATLVIIYPNSDAGGGEMIDAIESHPVSEASIVQRSLPREEYLGLLAASDVLVGNSSSGIIEAPSLGLPVVDIGPRQDGRERADNTVSVPHDTTAITDAIRQCLTDEAFRRRARECSNPYDHGPTGVRIASVLAEVDLGEQLLRKETKL
jgi:UDP-N-acetylglucosamine 2-epimerase (non-hydrolysing)/GDP/UDP-N,N'-diacetylbacillosamine 2-epimerase (hydrolysing)